MNDSDRTDKHSTLNAKLECFGDRLKMAMKGETPYAAHKRTGITESLLRKYISGESSPNIDRAVELADAFSVNIQWLATGEGKMSKSEDDSEINITVVANSEQSPSRKDIKSLEPPKYRGRSAPGSPAKVTADLLAFVIEAIEEYLNREGKRIDAHRKAALIQLCYEHCQLNPDQDRRETVNRFLKLLG